ncbi:MAG: energy transducer TonB [Sphingomonas sp.]
MTYISAADPAHLALSVSRKLAAPDSTLQIIAMTEPLLTVLTQSSAPAKGILTLTDGTTIALEGRRDPYGRRYRVAMIAHLSADALGHIRQSDRLSMTVEEPALKIVDMPGPGHSVDDIGVCEKASLAELGLDPARRAPSPPLEDQSKWITYDDYPPSALRNARTGSATALLTIGTDGVPTSIRLIRSTGTEVLEEATTRLLLARARFTPMPSVIDRWSIVSVDWNIPD